LLEGIKAHHNVPKGIRVAASSEPHSSLQYFLFLFAKKQEELARQVEIYENLSKQQKELIHSWETMLITPIKVTHSS
jgi:hypothetical protein